MALFDKIFGARKKSLSQLDWAELRREEILLTKQRDKLFKRVETIADAKQAIFQRGAAQKSPELRKALAQDFELRTQEQLMVARELNLRSKELMTVSRLRMMRENDKAGKATGRLNLTDADVARIGGLITDDSVGQDAYRDRLDTLLDLGAEGDRDAVAGAGLTSAGQELMNIWDQLDRGGVKHGFRRLLAALSAPRPRPPSRHARRRVAGSRRSRRRNRRPGHRSVRWHPRRLSLTRVGRGSSSASSSSRTSAPASSRSSSSALSSRSSSSALSSSRTSVPASSRSSSNASSSSSRTSVPASSRSSSNASSSSSRTSVLASSRSSSSASSSSSRTSVPASSRSSSSAPSSSSRISAPASSRRSSSGQGRIAGGRASRLADDRGRQVGPGGCVRRRASPRRQFSACVWGGPAGMAFGALAISASILSCSRLKSPSCGPVMSREWASLTRIGSTKRPLTITS